MRSAEEIRDELRRWGAYRTIAQAKVLQADEAIGFRLAEVQAHPEITMSEAADIAGVSRPLAYRLMGKVGGSEQ